MSATKRDNCNSQSTPAHVVSRATQHTRPRVSSMASSAATSVAYVTVVYSDYRKGNEFEVVAVDGTEELARARAKEMVDASRADARAAAGDDDDDDEVDDDEVDDEYVFIHGVVLLRARLAKHRDFFSPILAVIQVTSGSA